MCLDVEATILLPGTPRLATPCSEEKIFDLRKKIFYSIMITTRLKLIFLRLHFQELNCVLILSTMTQFCSWWSSWSSGTSTSSLIEWHRFTSLPHWHSSSYVPFSACSRSGSALALSTHTNTTAAGQESHHTPGSSLQSANPPPAHPWSLPELLHLYLPLLCCLVVVSVLFCSVHHKKTLKNHVK